MLWIAARWVIACVADDQPVRDFALRTTVHDAVRLLHLAVQPELPVPGVSYYAGEITGAEQPAIPLDQSVTVLDPAQLFRDCGYVETSAIIRPDTDLVVAPREWRKFGKRSKKKTGYDVLYAFRPEKFYRGENLPHKEYTPSRARTVVKTLVGDGLKVGCVGGQDNFFAGGDDLRGTPLDKLCDIMASAEVIVGPSSGPMHLAQQCETPLVTWYPQNPGASKFRYELHWNPFGSEVEFLNPGPNVQPKVAEVVAAVRSFL